MVGVDLQRIDYEEDPSLQVTFEVDENFLVLYCKVQGLIAYGSKGNNAADHLFGKLCQYYFQTNCYCLILDLSQVNYQFGDRLQKSVNFFNYIGRDEHEKQQPIILILSEHCEQGVQSLLSWINPKGQLITKDKLSAIETASKLLAVYLGEDE